MKLIQIQYYLTVAECKSITKAAEQMFVSQPALSKQMNLLEEELGVQLLKRTPAGIELTEIGEEFAKDCKIIIQDVDRAVSKAVSAGQKTPDVLRVGCFDGAVVEDFLPGLYDYFRKTAPDMKIKLGRHSFGENRQALAEDSIDMLIELRFLNDDPDDFQKKCSIKPLVRRRGALIYSENSPLAKKKNIGLKDFKKETMIKLADKEDDILSKTGEKRFKALGIEGEKEEYVDNFVTLLSSVKLGLGFSPLSHQVAETIPGVYAFDLPEELGVEVIAVWKKDNKIVRKLMEQFREPIDDNQ